jgi:Uma2 family endonuclease
MVAQRNHRYTVEEYLAFERAGADKHEYVDGKIYALAGSSEAHNLIISNVITLLNTQLRRRPCKVYPSDMRLRIPQTRRYVYPDISVVCGTALFDDQENDILLNPVVLFEVLSESTEMKDRGWKFHQYQKIENLQEYILIAQNCMQVEHFVNQGAGYWLFTTYTASDSNLALKAIDCTLALADVYDKVNLSTQEEENDDV